MLKAEARKLAFKGHWFRIWMPYCFEELSAGKKTVWMPLNRNYKPLGHSGGEYVDYENFIAQAIQFSRDPRTFKGIWIDAPMPNSTQLWLYEDASSSRIDYFARLEKLVAKQPKLFGPSAMC